MKSIHCFKACPKLVLLLATSIITHLLVYSLYRKGLKKHLSFVVNIVSPPTYWTSLVTCKLMLELEAGQDPEFDTGWER